MSDPFIVWTMRRTGGTTLMSLLTELSEHPGTQHEPFNPDRKFGHVTRAWTEDGNAAALNKGMDDALADPKLIKHCYELVPEVVNIALIRAASDRGYRHIVLDRQDEVDRITSLELAKITGAWGADEAASIYAEIKRGTREVPPVNVEDARDHMIACADLRRWLAARLGEDNRVPLLVYFEEIYGDQTSGRRTVEELLDCLGITPGKHPRYQEILREALTEKSQNSQSIAHAVPNIEALRETLQTVYETEGYRFERARRVAPKSPPAAMEDQVPELPELLVLDLHAGVGENTAFYLAKGFKVLAVTATRGEAEALRAQLGPQIDAGVLTVIRSDLSATGQSKPLIDNISAKFGRPHYARVTGPKGITDLIAGLTGVAGLPPNLSFPLNPVDWEANIAHLAGLGYETFQIVRQGAKHLPPPPKPAREGRYVPVEFTATMSGTFGRELPPEAWHGLGDFREHVTIVQARREEARAAGRPPGWYDIHCRLAD